MNLLKKFFKPIYRFGLTQLILNSFRILHHLLIYIPSHRSEYNPLKKYKNIHKGQRCFIVATGPSLTIEDVNKLKGEICFGMNSVYKLFDKTEWRPRYYCIYDKKVFGRIYDELKNVNFECAFYTDNLKWEAPFTHKVGLWDNWRGNSRLEMFLFPDTLQNKQQRISRDISKYVYAGTSVVHVIMQICFYMGFEEIYLIGADCNFGGSEKHSKIVAYKGSDQITESPEYIYKCLMRDYKRAYSFAEKNNIHIYNATRGGKLEIFPRKDLDEVLSR